MNLKKNETLNKIFVNKSGKKYDVCVMYSGGKDSSFLLYLLKEVYGLRVKAVMVDNGFETPILWKTMKEFTKNMGVDLEVIEPGEMIFKELFNVLVTHNNAFQREKVNHICFICNNLLWATVVRYAYDNGIPYVASGLSIDQLSSGRRKLLVPNKLGNSIAEKSTQKIFVDSLAQLNNIKDDKFRELKTYFDNIYKVKGSVKTVYPYIYHDISIEDIKGKLLELDWQTPNGLSNSEYISSGCKIMRIVISELEKLEIITLNEREQAKSMIEKGHLDGKEIEFATYNAVGQKVDLTDPLFDYLGIKDFLVNICKQKNNDYIA